MRCNCVMHSVLVVALGFFVGCFNTSCVSDEALAAALTPLLLEEIYLDGVSPAAPVAVIESAACGELLSVYYLPDQSARRDYFLDAMWYSDRQWSQNWNLSVRDVDEAQAVAYVRSIRHNAAEKHQPRLVILMPADHIINARMDAIARESQGIEVIVRCYVPESFENPAEFQSDSAAESPRRGGGL